MLDAVHAFRQLFRTPQNMDANVCFWTSSAQSLWRCRPCVLHARDVHMWRIWSICMRGTLRECAHGDTFVSMRLDMVGRLSHDRCCSGVLLSISGAGHVSLTCVPNASGILGTRWLCDFVQL